MVMLCYAWWPRAWAHFYADLRLKGAAPDVATRLAFKLVARATVLEREKSGGV